MPQSLQDGENFGQDQKFWDNPCFSRYFFTRIDNLRSLMNNHECLEISIAYMFVERKHLRVLTNVQAQITPETL